MPAADRPSIAAMRVGAEHLCLLVGGSTGTALWAAFQIIADMRKNGEKGGVVSVICDHGERYLDTYYNDEWVENQGIDLAPYFEELLDRKSTRLNSSHVAISYAVFCLKKKMNITTLE